MSVDRRTKWLLAGLGVALMIFAWQRLAPRLFVVGDATNAEDGRVGVVEELLASDGSAPSASPATRSARGRRRAAPAPVTRVVDLRLDELNPSAGQYESGRNPFAYFLPPPPPPPRPPGPTPEELEARRLAAAEAAARAAALAANPPPPPRPKPPPVPYTYLGRFGPRSRPIAVLAEGEAIHNVLLGDVLDGKFRLVEIGFESIELEYVDFPDVPAARLPVGTEGT